MLQSIISEKSDSKNRVLMFNFAARKDKKDNVNKQFRGKTESKAP